jgi:hypothetical protein
MTASLKIHFFSLLSHHPSTKHCIITDTDSVVKQTTNLFSILNIASIYLVIRAEFLQKSQKTQETASLNRIYSMTN